MKKKKRVLQFHPSSLIFHIFQALPVPLCKIHEPATYSVSDSTNVALDYLDAPKTTP